MKLLSSLFFVATFALNHAAGAPFDDPAPPKSAELSEMPAPQPQSFDRLKFHQAPAPLNKDARTSDWPRFLGPSDDASSPETHLLHEWPKAGPARVWEVEKGEGYTSQIGRAHV